jgi:hypothetical protein
MTNSELSKRTRISFLMSMILHVFLALVFSFILLERHQEAASEYMTVDMIAPSRRIIPPRRIEARDSILDLRQSSRQRLMAPSNPQRQNPSTVEADYSFLTDESDRPAASQDLTTDADLLKSRFEMAIPKAKGADIVKPGTGSKQSIGERGGAGSIGPSDGAGIFEMALYSIARDVLGKNKTGKEDVVFLVDASGSMEENIAAVARYLSRMIEVFEDSDLDYTMGVISFNSILKDNFIKVYEQTQNANEIRNILRSIKCDGDERTLDAIEVGLTKVEFRDSVDKTFILVTDEHFLPRTATRQTHKGLSLKDMLDDDFREIVKMCRDDGVKVSVLGIDDEMHKSLAKETKGLWFQIPQQDGVM